MLERPIAIGKISDFLEGRISAEDLHQWAFSVALSSEYDDLNKKDPLLGTIVGSLFGLKITSPRDKKLRRTLVYYQKCLNGTAEFRQVVERPEEKRKSLTDYLLIFRIYVVVFSIAALILQAVPLFKIVFNLSTAIMVNAWQEALFKLLPHVVYSLVLFIPLKITAQGWKFYPSAMIMLAGMAYYWWTTVVFVMQLFVHMVFVLVFIPFGALPATLAILLLIIRKIEYIQRDQIHLVRLR